MGETLGHAPEVNGKEVSETQFDAAQQKMEAAGITPENPQSNEELKKIWDKEGRGTGINPQDKPETWQTGQQ